MVLTIIIVDGDRRDFDPYNDDDDHHDHVQCQEEKFELLLVFVDRDGSKLLQNYVIFVNGPVYF